MPDCRRLHESSEDRGQFRLEWRNGRSKIERKQDQCKPQRPLQARQHCIDKQMSACEGAVRQRNQGRVDADRDDTSRDRNKRNDGDVRDYGKKIARYVPDFLYSAEIHTHFVAVRTSEVPQSGRPGHSGEGVA
jgi:hypothetical protein